MPDAAVRMQFGPMPSGARYESVQSDAITELLVSYDNPFQLHRPGHEWAVGREQVLVYLCTYVCVCVCFLCLHEHVHEWASGIEQVNIHVYERACTHRCVHDLQYARVH